MTNHHHISSIFHTDWSHLKAEQAASLLSAQNELIDAKRSEDFDEQGRLQFICSSMLAKDHKLFKRMTGEQIRDVFADIGIYEKIWLHFHVTWIKCAAAKLMAPEERLTDFVFEQLVDADTEYSNFLVESVADEKKAEQHLNRLIAILYRPESEEYNERQARRYADLLPKDLTFQYKYLILRTYANIRSSIMNQFDELFPKSAPSEDYQPVRLWKMWHDILVDLAQTEQYPGMDKAKKAPIYEALYVLNKKAAEARELRDKMKK